MEQMKGSNFIHENKITSVQYLKNELKFTCFMNTVASGPLSNMYLKLKGFVRKALIATPIGVATLYSLRLWMQGPTKGSDNPKQLTGKTVVITGANTGIGKATATDLAKREAKVIICCRDKSRAEKAVQDIKNESNNHDVTFALLDLASFNSVRKCAEELNQKVDKIDFLINNAGIMMCPAWKTEDGFDMQMGTNHFGHFLFTELVLPLMQKSIETGHHPRIVIVSSIAHGWASKGLSFDDINFERNFSTAQAYAESKLANILHAKELAERLDGNISVYALHPGVISTELGRHITEWFPRPFKSLANKLAHFVLKDPFHGAQTTLYCTLEDSIERQSGLYYSDCNVKTPKRQGQDMEAARMLRELSFQMVKSM